jgi:hypothetical protein
MPVLPNLSDSSPLTSHPAAFKSSVAGSYVYFIKEVDHGRKGHSKIYFLEFMKIVCDGLHNLEDERQISKSRLKIHGGEMASTCLKTSHFISSLFFHQVERLISLSWQKTLQG